jgi:O-methyltransferase involved in polyketide biosynthesis
VNAHAITLQGVPETMLWTLHARAGEFHQGRGVLRDARAAALAKQIDYDFDGRFGPPNRLFAVRAALLDAVITTWMVKHPRGLVVSLGEGLETQAWRVDNGMLRWLSVDLPEGILAREVFLAPGGRFAHLAADVAGTEWLDAIDASHGVFFVAQGLFMYLQPAIVETIFCRIAGRFPGAELAFDIVPRWLSAATRIGHQQSASYQLPPMPWGLDRWEIAPTLRRWHPGLRRLRFLPYRIPGRLPRAAADLLDRVMPTRQARPSLVQVGF